MSCQAALKVGVAATSVFAVCKARLTAPHGLKRKRAKRGAKTTQRENEVEVVLERRKPKARRTRQRKRQSRARAERVGDVAVE